MKKLNEKIAFMFLLAKAEAAASRRLSGQGLSLADLAVLHAIAVSPEGKARRTDLADAVGLTASGVTRLLLPLEKIGVVARESAELDARVSFVVLTKAGKQLLQDVLTWTEFKVEDMLPDVDAKKLDIATHLLKKIA